MTYLENDSIQAPGDVFKLTEEMKMPTLPDISLHDVNAEDKDIFCIQHQKAWDKSVEARCDFQFHLRLTRRASTNFISIWQKSVFGRTLTDIKKDDSMVPFFVNNLCPVIQEMIGYHLQNGNWALVTTPMRRHKVKNFASRIAESMADNLNIPFYFDCAHCRSRQRINAVFDANNIPRQQNVIVFDDFVTTGSTLLAMKNLLQKEGKNVIFFCGINNKL
ncbi:MAG: phosphoribosyltransferase [Bacteroidaceae bacterium]|nr:phosphoribosyltransferase [Bacteroidaceae bacterium]